MGKNDFVDLRDFEKPGSIYRAKTIDRIEDAGQNDGRPSTKITFANGNVINVAASLAEVAEQLGFPAAKPSTGGVTGRGIGSRG